MTTNKINHQIIHILLFSVELIISRTVTLFINMNRNKVETTKTRFSEYDSYIRFFFVAMQITSLILADIDKSTFLKKKSLQDRLWRTSFSEL